MRWKEVAMRGWVQMGREPQLSHQTTKNQKNFKIREAETQHWAKKKDSTVLHKWIWRAFLRLKAVSRMATYPIQHLRHIWTSSFEKEKKHNSFWQDTMEGVNSFCLFSFACSLGRNVSLVVRKQQTFKVLQPFLTDTSVYNKYSCHYRNFVYRCFSWTSVSVHEGPVTLGDLWPISKQDNIFLIFLSCNYKLFGGMVGVKLM